MALTFYIALLGIALLYATLWKYEMAAKNARGQVRALRRMLLGEDVCAAPASERGPVVSLLLAVAPALPLHTAGKYVAGAYIVFLAPDLVYVAIMANRAAPHRARAGGAAPGRRGPAQPSATRSPRPSGWRECPSCSPSASPTRPRRSRCASASPCPKRGRREFLRDLRGAAEVHEAVAVSTCNRTELYLVVGDPVEAESTALSMLATPGRDPAH